MTYSDMLNGGSNGKGSACNMGDLGSIPGSGKSPGERNGNPLQYSCLENSMDRGAWWATVHGVTKSHAQLSDFQLFTLFLEISLPLPPASLPDSDKLYIIHRYSP